MQLLLTLLLFSWISVIHAGAIHRDQPCNIKLNRLLAGSLQFSSECDSQTFCNPSGTCQRRGCRRDDFPFGYSQGDKGIPDKCPKGQFCPDEEDLCQPLLPVGSPCQLNRDGAYREHARSQYRFDFPFQTSARVHRISMTSQTNPDVVTTPTAPFASTTFASKRARIGERTFKLIGFRFQVGQTRRPAKHAKSRTRRTSGMAPMDKPRNSSTSYLGAFEENSHPLKTI